MKLKKAESKKEDTNRVMENEVCHNILCFVSKDVVNSGFVTPECRVKLTELR